MTIGRWCVTKKIENPIMKILCRFWTSLICMQHRDSVFDIKGSNLLTSVTYGQLWRQPRVLHKLKALFKKIQTFFLTKRLPIILFSMNLFLYCVNQMDGLEGLTADELFILCSFSSFWTLKTSLSNLCLFALGLLSE